MIDPLRKVAESLYDRASNLLDKRSTNLRVNSIECRLASLAEKIKKDIPKQTIQDSSPQIFETEPKKFNYRVKDQIDVRSEFDPEYFQEGQSVKEIVNVFFKLSNKLSVQGESNIRKGFNALDVYVKEVLIPALLNFVQSDSKKTDDLAGVLQPLSTPLKKSEIKHVLDKIVNNDCYQNFRRELKSPYIISSLNRMVFSKSGFVLVPKAGRDINKKIEENHLEPIEYTQFLIPGILVGNQSYEIDGQPLEKYFYLLLRREDIFQGRSCHNPMTGEATVNMLSDYCSYFSVTSARALLQQGGYRFDFNRNLVERLKKDYNQEFIFYSQVCSTALEEFQHGLDWLLTYQDDSKRLAERFFNWLVKDDSLFYKLRDEAPYKLQKRTGTEVTILEIDRTEIERIIKELSGDIATLFTFKDPKLALWQVTKDLAFVHNEQRLLPLTIVLNLWGESLDIFKISSPHEIISQELILKHELEKKILDKIDKGEDVIAPLQASLQKEFKHRLGKLYVKL